MKKKEYIEKIANLIVNRLNFHSPNLNNPDIDYSLLDAVGIDVSLPIFIFKKSLDNIFYEAFLKAQNWAKFNLVLFCKPQISSTKLMKLTNVYIFKEEDIPTSLFYALDALNVNYLTHSDFKNTNNREYLKINNEEIKYDFYQFYYHKKQISQGVIFEIKEFLLSGKNYFLTLFNPQKEERKVNIEFNLPLKRGYYFFKKEKNCVVIENVTNGEKMFFNHSFSDAKFCFSCVGGIESSTYACISFKIEVSLLPKQMKRIFFNFTRFCYTINSPKEMDLLFAISQNKMNEIFDIKVVSSDFNFDNVFNRYLPRKIWEKWQNFDSDEESEKEWLKMKSKIVLKSEKGEQINQLFTGLKEVKFFRNYGWKRVFIVHNNAVYLFADRVKYFNYTLLTKDIFKKNNEIYLSFA